MSPATPALRAAIAHVYRQISAPAWAAPNLDALADVLRDLSWLPDGQVVVREPRLPPSAGLQDRARLRAVLDRAVQDSRNGTHPIRLERRR